MANRMKRSLLMKERKDFVVDHPFVFFISTKGGSIIFVGRMTKIDSMVQYLTKEEL